MDAIGRVEAIHVAAAAGEPMRVLDRARALAGAGLEGDRYATRSGHWSPMRRSGDGLTLIDAIVVDGLVARGLDRDATRRNVLTRGTFRAVRRCEPCSYLDGLLGTSVLHDLVHRGGIRVEVLTDGWIGIGDPVQAVHGEPAARATPSAWQSRSP